MVPSYLLYCFKMSRMEFLFLKALLEDDGNVEWVRALLRIPFNGCLPKFGRTKAAFWILGKTVWLGRDPERILVQSGISVLVVIRADRQ